MQKRNPPSIFATLLARLRTGKAVVKAPATAPRPYQAISIHHGTVCCAIARKLEGVRFLAKDAPPLPLTGCNMRATCHCSYNKHSDRRTGSRRLSELGVNSLLFSAQERRRAKGRRGRD